MAEGCCYAEDMIDPEFDRLMRIVDLIEDYVDDDKNGNITCVISPKDVSLSAGQDVSLVDDAMLATLLSRSVLADAG
jgi:hypothetical protein